MDRSYIRHTRNRPGDKQRKILLAAGMPANLIYEEKKGGAALGFPDRGALIRSLRRGDRLCVAGLGPLGANDHDLRTAMRYAFERKASVYDALLKHEITSDKMPAIECFAQAKADWKGERTMKGREEARAKGRLGGRPWGKMKVLHNEAKRIWADKTLTNDQAAKLIGLSVSSCRNKLGGGSGREKHKFPKAAKPKPAPKRKPRK